jgi:predicted Fe-Mo cluster-binding NifX family protein
MRIAVASTGPSLDSMISPTCTEASHIVYMDLLSGEFYAFEIPHTHPVESTEFPIAESLMGAGVCAVLMQACKPEVQRTLQEGGIRVYTHISGRVSEGIERYKQGDLSPEPKLPNVMQAQVRGWHE